MDIEHELQLTRAYTSIVLRIASLLACEQRVVNLNIRNTTLPTCSSQFRFMSTSEGTFQLLKFLIKGDAS